MSGALPPTDDEDEVDVVPVWRRKRVLMAAGGVVLVLAFIFTRSAPPKAEDVKPKNDRFIGAVVAYTPPPGDPSTPGRDATQADPPAPPPAPTAPTLALGKAAKEPAKPVRPVMLSYGVQIEPVRQPPGPPAEPGKTGFDFKSATLPGTKASPAMDETYLLQPGLLPLVLDTAIQSDLPGPLLAHLPGPVYSNRGVLLMEAGTQIIGRYESLRSGGNRLRAVSTYAHTPNGVWVPLADGPLADDLGRSGLDGTVDNHLLQRFGGALLLELTQSALGIVQAEVGKGGNTYLQLNTGGGGVGSLAQDILRSTINIPPTFNKHQGETIALFLDQPISFADSYRIRAAGRNMP